MSEQWKGGERESEREREVPAANRQRPCSKAILAILIATSKPAPREQLAANVCLASTSVFNWHARQVQTLRMQNCDVLATPAILSPQHPMYVLYVRPLSSSLAPFVAAAASWERIEFFSSSSSSSSSSGWQRQRKQLWHETAAAKEELGGESWLAGCDLRLCCTLHSQGHSEGKTTFMLGWPQPLGKNAHPLCPRCGQKASLAK